VSLIVVTGTGTDVGKTYVTAATARMLRDQGAEVHARKPVQSFAEGDATTDADVLAAATGEDAHDVCPPHRWLPLPMAPPMAAAALGRPPFTIADLVGELRTPATDVTLVEGAGGLRSPLAHDGDTRTFIERLQPDAVLLVADAGLGTINLVRLTDGALAPRYRPIVFLNRFDAHDDLHVRERGMVAQRAGPRDRKPTSEALASHIRRDY
jgi:Dethiobiotin synthetase